MPHKILIVEDESLIGWSMANALGKAGYEPEVVQSGEDAVEKVRGGGIELVISDYRLPRMDGLDLASRVKAISGAVPVIIVSAEEEITNPGPGSVRSVDAMVGKPFNLAAIVTLVGEMLNSSPSDVRKSPVPEN